MIAGYVRLSRDDDKRNYTSIENQKLILKQYAASKRLVIGRWYEDDGFSGYSFNRPAFNQLMEDLDKDVDAVIAKDFSRIGRHNAKVLLLLDEFLERGKRLIVIDDAYDSSHPDDDVIGIKTWYNERYVKDTSKKIKKALAARQKEGTLLTRVPFGYLRNENEKNLIEILPEEAECVRTIFHLYLQGFGYRKIANHLTEQGVPTPSALARERLLASGKTSKRKVALEWSDAMVKDILSNDFYIGTYRLHKRARATVHGKDKRIPKDEQYVFENHHPPILDKMTFDLVKETKEKRMRTNYRGNRGKPSKANPPSPFGACLFCKDCGSRLTPIVRKNLNKTRKYYICSTYNAKGKRYCSKAHLINETDLMGDVAHYIRLCRDALCDTIATYDGKDFESERQSLEEKRIRLQDAIDDRKKQLKQLFSQKLKDASAHPDKTDLINETYESLQNDLLNGIRILESQADALYDAKVETPDVKDASWNALSVLDRIIEIGILERRDIETFIKRITVNEDGMPDIELRYGLSGLLSRDPGDELNRMLAEGGV